MSKEKYGKWVTKLGDEANSKGDKFQKIGSRYYFASYALMIVSVSSSIVAGILAMIDQEPEVARALIGAVALIPAFCVTIAGQLKLIEKADFFYLNKEKYHAFARAMGLAALGDVTAEQARAASSVFDSIEGDAASDFVKRLTFDFEGSPDPQDDPQDSSQSTD